MKGIPFCRSKAERAAYRRWAGRLEHLGVELGAADVFVVALLATREARLEDLGRRLVQCRDETRRLRLIAAERLAAADMAKALDAAERAFGGLVEDVAVVQGTSVRATGTGQVVTFPTGAEEKRPGPLAQRIFAVLAGERPLTKAELRRRVAGAQGDFLRGLREALSAGLVKRSGQGTKARPFRYGR
jgi:hypothetical protein